MNKWTVTLSLKTQVWGPESSVHNVWVTRKWTSRDKGIPHVPLVFTVSKILTTLFRIYVGTSSLNSI